MSEFCHWVLNVCSGHLLDQTQSFSQGEFTQPLGVGLGLAVRIKNQFSHPVCTGRHTDTYTTINNTQSISWENWLFTRECSCRGIGEFMGMGYHVSNMQMMQANESQLIMSRGSCTKRSHKSIAQTNRTRQDDIMSKNGNDK